MKKIKGLAVFCTLLLAGVGVARAGELILSLGTDVVNTSANQRGAYWDLGYSKRVSPHVSLKIAWANMGHPINFDKMDGLIATAVVGASPTPWLRLSAGGGVFLWDATAPTPDGTGTDVYGASPVLVGDVRIATSKRTAVHLSWSRIMLLPSCYRQFRNTMMPMGGRILSTDVISLGFGVRM